jgi:hypothetical protein
MTAGKEDHDVDHDITTERLPLTSRPTFKALEAHYEQIRELDLRTQCGDDPTRGEHLTAGSARVSTAASSWSSTARGSPSNDALHSASGIVRIEQDTPVAGVLCGRADVRGEHGRGPLRPWPLRRDKLNQFAGIWNCRPPKAARHA